MLSTYSRLLVKLTAALIALAGIQVANAAGDPARGEKLADTCKGCHAVDTYNNVYPTYHVPKIAGQNAGYVVSALVLYRDGQRAHSTMVAQAASLTDQDIDDIGAYLAGTAGEQPGTDDGNAPEAAQVCAACHGQTGISPIPTNPNLAGQHYDYLKEALDQYRRGDRKGPNAIAMQAQLMAVSEEDLDAIVRYYANQEGLAALKRSN